MLRSEESRKRLREEVRPSALSWDEMWVTYFKNPENKKYEGVSISELARLRDQHPVDVLCDLLVEEDLQTSYHAMISNLKTLPAFISHPLSMIGSDAALLGDSPSVRGYGTYPAILGEFVRDDGQMSLPTGIRKITSFPAQRLGIPDRGILRDGMKADITVFDPKKVKSLATRTDPKQFPLGIPYVIVNGTVVIDNGSHTGAVPGRALKHGRPST